MLFNRYPGQRRPSVFLLLLFIVFGFYFLNYPLQFVKIPAGFATVDKWIIFVGGVLLIIGGINHFIKISRGY